MEPQHSQKLSVPPPAGRVWDVRAEAAAYSWLNDLPLAHSILLAHAPLLPTRELSRVKSTKTDYLHIEYETTSADVAGYYYRFRWHTPTASNEPSNGPAFVIERSTSKSFAEYEVLVIFSGDQFSKYRMAIAEQGLSEELRTCLEFTDRPNARDFEKLLEGGEGIQCWISDKAKSAVEKIKVGDTPASRVSVPLLAAIHHEVTPRKEDFEWLQGQLNERQTAEGGIDAQRKTIAALAGDCRDRGLPSLRAVFETMVKLDRKPASSAGVASQSLLSLTREAEPDYQKILADAKELDPSTMIEIFSKFLSAGGIDKKGKLLSDNIISLAKISPLHAYECVLMALRSPSLGPQLLAEAIRCIEKLPVSLRLAEFALKEVFPRIPHSDSRDPSAKDYQAVKQRLEKTREFELYPATANTIAASTLDGQTFPSRRLILSLIGVAAAGAVATFSLRPKTADQGTSVVAKPVDPPKPVAQTSPPAVPKEETPTPPPAPIEEAPLLPESRVSLYTLSPIDEEMLTKCTTGFQEKITLLRDAMERLASLDTLSEVQRLHLNHLVKEAIDSVPETPITISGDQTGLRSSAARWGIRADEWHRLVETAIEDPVANFALLRAVVALCPSEDGPREYGRVRDFPAEWSLFRTLEGLAAPQFVKHGTSIKGGSLIEGATRTVIKDRVGEFAGSFVNFNEYAGPLFKDYTEWATELRRFLGNQALAETGLFKQIARILYSVDQQTPITQQADIKGLTNLLSLILTKHYTTVGSGEGQTDDFNVYLAQTLLTLHGIELLWPILNDPLIVSPSKDASSPDARTTLNLPVTLMTLIPLAKSATGIRQFQGAAKNELSRHIRLSAGDEFGESESIPATWIIDPKTGKAIRYPGRTEQSDDSFISEELNNARTSGGWTIPPNTPNRADLEDPEQQPLDARRQNPPTKPDGAKQLASDHALGANQIRTAILRMADTLSKL